MKSYNQLTLNERKKIEEGLDEGLSFRKIAELIDRNASTVSREVRENLTRKVTKPREAKCKDADWCKRIGICKERCQRAGAYCAGCDVNDCRDICPVYAEQTTCTILTSAPWVCNSCRKRRYGCRRHIRSLYDANLADAAAKERRSESRSGIDMEPERALVVLARIREGVKRGLSPYEISRLYADEVGVSPSTIYRWVEAGYGGLTNLELQRKVSMRPRKHAARAKPSAHTKKRRYAAFCELPEDVQGSAAEMDTVLGQKRDARCLLTLYMRAGHLQLALPLEDKTEEEVHKALKKIKSVCPERLFHALFSPVLTDNGTEFADEVTLAQILDEHEQGGIALYYCDVRASQQKGGCEKNHTELRQIVEKGAFSLERFTARDAAVLMSHANSNPRKSLLGMTPIDAFLSAYGRDAQELLDALGIEKIDRDELNLTPDILNIERAKRGEEPLF